MMNRCTSEERHNFGELDLFFLAMGSNRLRICRV